MELNLKMTYQYIIKLQKTHGSQRDFIDWLLNGAAIYLESQLSDKEIDEILQKEYGETPQELFSKFLSLMLKEESEEEE